MFIDKIVHIMAHTVKALTTKGHYSFGRLKAFTLAQAPLETVGIKTHGDPDNVTPAFLNIAGMITAVNKIKTVDLTMILRCCGCGQHESGIMPVTAGAGG